MNKLKLSNKAKEIVRKLIDSKDSERAGDIVAIDPVTGEYYFGKTEVEAAIEGRTEKNDPKAVFYFVRIGYPAVHTLKSIDLQGKIHQFYTPKVIFNFDKEDIIFES